MLLCDGPVKPYISAVVALVKLEKIEFDDCPIRQKVRRRNWCWYFNRIYSFDSCYTYKVTVDTCGSVF